MLSGAQLVSTWAVQPLGAATTPGLEKTDGVLDLECVGEFEETDGSPIGGGNGGATWERRPVFTG